MEHPDSKAKVLYRLTPKGIDLLPILIEIGLWAEKYYPISDAQKKILQEVKEDKELYIKKAIGELLKG